MPAFVQRLLNVLVEIVFLLMERVGIHAPNVAKPIHILIKEILILDFFVDFL